MGFPTLSANSVSKETNRDLALWPVQIGTQQVENFSTSLHRILKLSVVVKLEAVILGSETTKRLSLIELRSNSHHCSL